MKLSCKIRAAGYARPKYSIQQEKISILHLYFKFVYIIYRLPWFGKRFNGVIQPQAWRSAGYFTLFSISVVICILFVLFVFFFKFNNFAIYQNGGESQGVGYKAQVGKIERKRRVYCNYYSG